MDKDIVSGSNNSSQPDPIENVRKTFKESFCKDIPFGISYIRAMAHIAVIGIEKICSPLCSEIVLGKEDLQRMENLAVSFYLDEWLENDANATQTIRSFATKKYVLRSEREQHWGVQTLPDSYRLSSLHRAEYVLTNMQKFRTGQARKEGSKEVLLSGNKGTGGIWYDFVSLRFLDLYSQRKLSLFELLALRKEIMRTTSEKKPYQSLKNAYEEYDSIFKNAGCLSDREYTISCIQMQKMEYTYRFYLCAEIAKCAVDQGLSIEKVKERLHSNEAKFCWGRFESPRLLTSNHVLLNQSIDISNYHQEITCIFNEEKTVAEKVYLFRTLLMNAIDIMNCLADPKSQRSWNPDDFRDAAKHFRKEAHIFECRAPVALKASEKDTDKFYHYIREIYQELAENKEMPLYFFRQEMQTARKIKNKQNKSET